MMHIDIGSCSDITLEISYTNAMIYPNPIHVYQANDYSLINWLTSIIEHDDDKHPIPYIHVLNYLNDVARQNSVEYMQYINYHLIFAAARGYSILHASGDNGAWGHGGLFDTEYSPDFPSASPWITSIGGSNVQNHQNVHATESVWECSGGGFSSFFASPKYQRKTVSNYFDIATRENKLPPRQYYNASGRGYPDLVAVGGETHPYCVALMNGKTIGVSSTFAATSTVASLFVLINQLQMERSSTPLGFLNPFLYSDAMASCYSDINDGSNNNCHHHSGFQTSAGWDAASGFGSLNYKCAVNAALRVSGR